MARRTRRSSMNQMSQKYEAGVLVHDSMKQYKRVELPNVWLAGYSSDSDKNKPGIILVPKGSKCYINPPCLTNLSYHLAHMIYSQGKGVLKCCTDFIKYESLDYYPEEVFELDKQFEANMESIKFSCCLTASEDLYYNQASKAGLLEINNETVIYGPVYFSLEQLGKDGYIPRAYEDQCYYQYGESKPEEPKQDEEKKEPDQQSEQQSESAPAEQDSSESAKEQSDSDKKEEEKQEEKKTHFTVEPTPIQFVQKPETRLFAKYYPNYDRFFFTNEYVGEWVVLDYSMPTNKRYNTCCFAVLAKRKMEFPGSDVKQKVLVVTDWLSYDGVSYYCMAVPYGITEDSDVEVPICSFWTGTEGKISLYTVIKPQVVDAEDDSDDNSEDKYKIVPYETVLEVCGTGDGYWTIAEEVEEEHGDGLYSGTLTKAFTQNSYRNATAEVNVSGFDDPIKASSPLSKEDETLRKGQKVLLIKRGESWTIINAEC